MSNRFAFGDVVATPEALRTLHEPGQPALHFRQLHATGAWGDLSREDREANNRATAHEDDSDQRDRVSSRYRTRIGEKLLGRFFLRPALGPSQARDRCGCPSI